MRDGAARAPTAPLSYPAPGPPSKPGSPGGPLPPTTEQPEQMPGSTWTAAFPTTAGSHQQPRRPSPGEVRTNQGPRRPGDTVQPPKGRQSCRLPPPRGWPRRTSCSAMSASDKGSALYDPSSVRVLAGSGSQRRDTHRMGLSGPGSSGGGCVIGTSSQLGKLGNIWGQMAGTAAQQAAHVNKAKPVNLTPCVLPRFLKNGLSCVLAL